jgi:hypothetical protein
MSDNGKRFWQTVPGVMSGIAAMITAITGVVVVVREIRDVGEPTSDVAAVTPTSTYIATVAPTSTSTFAPTAADTATTMLAPTDTPTLMLTNTPTPIPTPADRMIESFESYGDDEALRAAYSTDAPENDASVSLSVARNVYAGNQSLAFSYDIHTIVPIDADIATDYAGLIRDFAIQDWRGFNYLRLWVRSDGSTKDLVIQFHEASGEVWKHTTNLSSFRERDLQLALDTSDFEPADWSPWINGEIDLGSVAGFSIYLGHAGPGRGTVWIDAIRLSG